MIELIEVNLADYKTDKAPNVLITHGLGSCIAVALYDNIAKIGGLSHIMLPDSSRSKSSNEPMKFADKSLPAMVDELIKKGAEKRRLVAKVAGGAQMFQLNKLSNSVPISEQNIKSVIQNLKDLEIPLVASELGGNCGRTVELFLNTGIFRVRTINEGKKDI